MFDKHKMKLEPPGMVPKRVPIIEAFAGLPDEWGEDTLPLIQSRLKESGQKVVVLDDDPTGAE